MPEFSSGQILCMVLCTLGTLVLIVFAVAAAWSERAVAKVKAKARPVSDEDIDRVYRSNIQVMWGDGKPGDDSGEVRRG